MSVAHAAAFCRAALRGYRASQPHSDENSEKEWEKQLTLPC